MSATASAPVSRLNLVLRDFDADGLADVVAATGSELLRFRQSPAGVLAFDKVLAGEPGGGFAGLAAGDLDADGRSDLALPVGSELRVYRQTGDGNFGAPDIRDLGGAVPAAALAPVAVADVTGDGLDDVVVAAAEGEGGAVRLFAQGPRGALGEAVTLASVGEPVVTVALADLDGDGLLDLVLATDKGEVHVYPQTAAGKFVPASPVPLDPLGAVVTAFAAAESIDAGSLAALGALAATGDVNGDGRADLLVTRPDRTLTIFRAR